jgi:hypothetical protein
MPDLTEVNYPWQNGASIDKTKEKHQYWRAFTSIFASNASPDKGFA